MPLRKGLSMKILCIGDIMGRVGRDMALAYLDRHGAAYDCILANGENAAHGRGLSKPVYEELKQGGIHGITMGNHVWGCPDIVKVFQYQDDVIRPANLSPGVPGAGSMLLKLENGLAVGVVNLLGRTFMQPPADCPFAAADREIQRLRQVTNLIFVDFHAEATSEKIAMGYYLDGRVTAVFGTHTHVQTADETILPGGTGYITDLGMCGPVHSVLGLDKNTIVHRFTTGMPQKFTLATGAGQFCGCVFDIDPEAGKTTAVERIFQR